MSRKLTRAESLWLKQGEGLESCQVGYLLILLTASSGLYTGTLALQRMHMEYPDQFITKGNILLCRKTYWLAFQITRSLIKVNFL